MSRYVDWDVCEKIPGRDTILECSDGNVSAHMYILWNNSGLVRNSINGKVVPAVIPVKEFTTSQVQQFLSRIYPSLASQYDPTSVRDDGWASIPLELHPVFVKFDNRFGNDVKYFDVSPLIPWKKTIAVMQIELLAGDGLTTEIGFGNGAFGIYPKNGYNRPGSEVPLMEEFFDVIEGRTKLSSISLINKYILDDTVKGMMNYILQKSIKGTRTSLNSGKKTANVRERFVADAKSNKNVMKSAIAGLMKTTDHAIAEQIYYVLSLLFELTSDPKLVDPIVKKFPKVDIFIAFSDNANFKKEYEARYGSLSTLEEAAISDLKEKKLDPEMEIIYDYKKSQIAFKIPYTRNVRINLTEDLKSTILSDKEYYDKHITRIGLLWK